MLSLAVLLSLVVSPSWKLAILTAPAVLSTQRASGDGVGPMIGILFWVGVLVTIVVALWKQRAPLHIETSTTLSPEDVIRTAVQTYTMSGWLVTSQTQDNATFTRRLNGSRLIAFMLLLIGIIPGLLYLAFRGRTISTNVYAKSAGQSMTSVHISSTASGWGARKAAERVIRSIPKTTVAAPQPIGG